jgi:hypothetical protein
MYVKIYLVMLFLWFRGIFNKQIMFRIKKMYGNSVIHFQNLQRWTLDFAARRTELDAFARLGRLIDPENANRIKELLESESDISQETL